MAWVCIYLHVSDGVYSHSVGWLEIVKGGVMDEDRDMEEEYLARG